MLASQLLDETQPRQRIAFQPSTSASRPPPMATFPCDHPAMPKFHQEVAGRVSAVRARLVQFNGDPVGRLVEGALAMSPLRFRYRRVGSRARTSPYSV
ncbi:hypothetical protein DMB37_37000 [Nocardia sp. CS682]|nr:hypothetical protein DMB37_37000 [Nocardia sp. CS682]